MVAHVGAPTWGSHPGASTWVITGSTAIRLDRPLPLVAPAPPPPETEQERLERRRQQVLDQQAAEREAEMAAREKADRRARKLLFKHLTKQQRADYESKGEFTVISSEGHRYVIDARRRQHNIYRLDENDVRIVEYCSSVSGGVPNDDNLLAQKMLLEADEAQFMRRANASHLRRR